MKRARSDIYEGESKGRKGSWGGRALNYSTVQGSFSQAHRESLNGSHLSKESSI